MFMCLILYLHIIATYMIIHAWYKLNMWFLANTILLSFIIVCPVQLSAKVYVFELITVSSSSHGVIRYVRSNTTALYHSFRLWANTK